MRYRQLTQVGRLVLATLLGLSIATTVAATNSPAFQHWQERHWSLYQLTLTEPSAKTQVTATKTPINWRLVKLSPYTQQLRMNLAPVVSTDETELEHGPIAELSLSSYQLARRGQSKRARPDSLVGSLGWQASYPLNTQRGLFRPYAQLTLDSNFKNFHTPYLTEDERVRSDFYRTLDKRADEYSLQMRLGAQKFQLGEVNTQVSFTSGVSGNGAQKHQLSFRLSW